MLTYTVLLLCTLFLPNADCMYPPTLSYFYQHQFMRHAVDSQEHHNSPAGLREVIHEYF